MTATDISPIDLRHLRYSIDRVGVATVLLDRAGERMNTLAPELFDDFLAVIDHLEADPAVRAVVVGSAKRDNFLAGADIRWLQALGDSDEVRDDIARGQRALQRLEDLWRVHGKPVVAAIHGPCLGGGLELALTAEYRVCSDDPATQLGQPEVKLGLIPAGGGTQRLPRLIGIAAAVDLILSGRSVRPRGARRMGLVDEVCPVEYLHDAARRLALDAVGAGRSIDLRARLTPSGLRKLVPEDNPLGRRVLFAKAEQRMLAGTGGNYPAPPAALRALRTGIEQGPAAGYATEASEFSMLVRTPEARALISLFLASQELKKQRVADVDPHPVKLVGVIGGGLMGSGIATVSATHAGVSSRIKELDDTAAGRALNHVHAEITSTMKRRRARDEETRRLLQLVTATTDWIGFASADLIIEAVFEDLELKQAVVRAAEEHGRQDMIFASNTSSLPVTDIAAAATRPDQVVGMHYFSPVEKMPLLEIVVTERTADWVTATCVELGKRQGKTVIVVNDGPGFYTTRVVAAYGNEAAILLTEGASVEAIDGAMVAWGFPVGPLMLQDEVGLDTARGVASVMHGAFGERFPIPETFVRLGDDRKGRRSGLGFYRYDEGRRTGVDPEIYHLLGVEGQRSIGRNLIQRRLAMAMINEAARCLEEGILRSARDGDVGAVFGLGFPPFRGGPFTWIDETGVARVVSALQEMEVEHGARYAPAQILLDHARSGSSIRSG